MTDGARQLPYSGWRSSWPLRLLLGVTLLLVIRFVLKNAIPYLGLDPKTFGDSFWPRRYGLLAHLAGGTVAILVGPIQFWLGAHRRQMAWHRKLGMLYLGGVTVGCIGGFYLALTVTGVGWAYSAGLFGLACAWAITTGTAYLAIRRRNIPQHREWMIRSYVVTLAFVFFRLADELMGTSTGADALERAKALAWICWTIPLLIAEPLIQWPKLKSRA
jgi:hypothetical protein